MVERRQIAVDRRRHTASPLSFCRLRGRRRCERRNSVAADVCGSSDIYPKHLLALTMTILLLCALDAHNTLQLIMLGAVEINPLMKLVLQQSSSLFVTSKFMLTGLALLILVPHHQARLLFGRISAEQILYGAVLGYTVLITYQWSIFPNSALRVLL